MMEKNNKLFRGFNYQLIVKNNLQNAYFIFGSIVHNCISHIHYYCVIDLNSRNNTFVLI